VWLHVSAFSRPSSGQYFPVEGKSVSTIHYGIPYCIQGVRKTIEKIIKFKIFVEHDVVYLKHYAGVNYQL
jgi:hypothetical protein